jgi:hypothetical protein
MANIGDSWVWHHALFAASKMKAKIFVVFVNIVQLISEFRNFCADKEKKIEKITE